MLRKCSIIMGVLALAIPPSIAGAGPASATARAQLDAKTIQAGLRTADADENAYIAYVVTLVNQGRLPRPMVDASFQWARRRAPSHKKFQYFKHALIHQAGRIRIRLPRGTPDLTPTIKGRVTVRVLMVSVPAPNITVTIRGTKRSVLTNAKGEFRFKDVPLSTYILDAQGIAAFLPKKGSTTVVLPPDPPATDSVFVTIPLK